jgi:hypothetical protein
VALLGLLKVGSKAPPQEPKLIEAKDERRLMRFQKMLSKRPAGAAPLGTICSLAYFTPVIEEVLQLKVGLEYFQHLRHKLQRIASAR